MLPTFSYLVWQECSVGATRLVGRCHVTDVNSVSGGELVQVGLQGGVDLVLSRENPHELDVAQAQYFRTGPDEGVGLVVCLQNPVCSIRGSCRG